MESLFSSTNGLADFADFLRGVLIILKDFGIFWRPFVNILEAIHG
jgi:hypothetical protein